MNAQKCAILAKDIESIGTTFKQYDRAFTVHTQTLPLLLKQELQGLGLCSDKYIPGHVLQLAPHILAHLLETLILGDGNCSKKNGQLSYYTTSKLLADDVQIIAQKLGMRATIRVRPACKGGTINGRQITGAKIG